MTPQDLAELARLFAKAAAIVPMRDIAAGRAEPDVIGLRHDVDDNKDSLETAVRMAEWEHKRGYRSTYFMLHGSSYWADEPRLRAALDLIAGQGHEIGIHTNAITEAFRTGSHSHTILADALGQLRTWDHEITGVAGHGDRLCYQAGFINDELFVECRRPDMGPPDRLLEHGGVHVKLQPRPLAHFGLTYESLRAGDRRSYLSDSGGTWNVPIASLDFPACGQLHVLQHPDWWAEAFPIVRKVAP